MLRDSAPAYSPLIVSRFLTRKSVSHPPYSPRLAPANLCLFPKLKLALIDELRFEDIKIIEKSVTAIIFRKKISINSMNVVLRL